MTEHINHHITVRQATVNNVTQWRVYIDGIIIATFSTRQQAYKKALTLKQIYGN